MESTEGLDEIARIQREYGAARLVVADEMEDWQHPVTSIEFDPGNQTIVITANR